MPNRKLEDYVPVVAMDGINTDKNATFGGNVAITGDLTVDDITLGDVSATGPITGTSTSASALAVGANGATNPVIKVNANTASVATGVTIVGAAAAGGVALAAISSGTDESVTFDAKGSGTVTINGTATGAISLARATGVTGALTVTSASASSLAVGRLGATTPAFSVDSATGTQVTGIKVTGGAAAGTVAVAVVGGTNENLTIDSNGSGTITLNGTGTGNIVLGRAATGVSTSVTGSSTTKSATAVPATAGAVAAGVPVSMYSSGITVEVTSDPPTHVRAKGSLCINTGGSSTSTRLYVNTDGSTGWAAITTAS